jgi:prepilin-type N-terminal cleavage/methylation domain-containing protein
MSPALAGERGFTLVELLTVVVITGILATVGFAALRGNVSAARGTEALNMVQSIRAAEERYRSEHMMYLNVSSDPEAWYPRNPTALANRNTEQTFFGATHADSVAWLQLRPTAPGPVRFGYICNAGNAGAIMPAPTRGPAVTWPTTTDNWYVIQAIGDTDWDGSISYYRASSLDDDVFRVNHGE